jgi:hypothetical protein
MPDASSLPVGGMFESMKRNGSMNRRKTFIRKVETKQEEVVADPVLEKNTAMNGMNVSPRKSIPKKKSGWKRFVEAWKSIFRPEYKGSDKLKDTLNATMTRAKPPKEEVIICDLISGSLLIYSSSFILRKKTANSSKCFG